MLAYDWRTVLKHAWSVRLMMLALIFIILEPIYTFMATTRVAMNIYIQLGMSAATGLLTVAAIIARPAKSFRRFE